MIELVLVLLGLVLITLGLVFGWFGRQLLNNVNTILQQFHQPEEPKPTITTSNPEFVNRNQAGHTESMIVEPKSAQLIDWEERQEIEQMNKTVKMKPR